MRNKKHALITLIISIPFILAMEIVPALLLISYSSICFYRYWNHPQRQLLSEIKTDSQKFNIKVPASYPLHLDFLKFYSKYLRLSTQFPALKNTYKELVESMWLKLSEENSIREWRNIIRATDASWPSPIDVKNLLKDSLNKVSTETKLMNEAMAKSR